MFRQSIRANLGDRVRRLHAFLILLGLLLLQLGGLLLLLLHLFLVLLGRLLHLLGYFGVLLRLAAGAKDCRCRQCQTEDDGCNPTECSFHSFTIWEGLGELYRSQSPVASTLVAGAQWPVAINCQLTTGYWQL